MKCHAQKAVFTQKRNSFNYWRLSYSITSYFRKTDNNEWILHDYFALNETVLLNSIQENLLMAEIYEDIVF